MRIGIDCRIMIGNAEEGGAGVAHATFFLVQSLIEQDRQNEYVLFVDQDYAVPMNLQRKNVKIVRFLQGSIPIYSSHVQFAKQVYAEKLDIFHGPGNVLPIGYNKKQVLTVHDLAIYKHPEWFPDGQFFSTKYVVPKSIRKARKIIAISEATKKDIQEIFGIEESKIAVIHHGFKKSELPVRAKKPYILFIGTIEPRKNLQNLVEAFEIIKRQKGYKKFKLILAGKKGWKDEKIWKKIENSEYKKDIEYRGFITEEQKQKLLNEAQVFVFPSLYEGFGIPLLEAMNQNVPVVATNIEASKEVARDAAHFVEKDAKSIAEGIQKIIDNEAYAKEVIQKGKQRAKQFDYKTMAQKTLNVYKEVAGK